MTFSPDDIGEKENEIVCVFVLEETIRVAVLTVMSARRVWQKQGGPCDGSQGNSLLPSSSRRAVLHGHNGVAANGKESPDLHTSCLFFRDPLNITTQDRTEGN
jgi:hypothetical protein